jgi:allophanate hydrolase subunit 1
MRISPIIARILHERDLTHKTFNGLQQEALNRLREIRKGLQDLLGQYDMGEVESQSLFERFDKIDTGLITD